MNDFEDTPGLQLSMVRGDGVAAVLIEFKGETAIILSHGSSPPGSRPEFDVTASALAEAHPGLGQRRLRLKVHQCTKETQADGERDVFRFKGRVLDLTRPVREALVAALDR